MKNATLIAVLEAWLPRQDSRFQASRITHLGQPSQGYSNVTRTFDIEWREGGRVRRTGAVFRATPPPPSLFPAYDLSVQYRCMQALAGTPVPVPNLLGFAAADAPAGTALGGAFYLMERAPGRVVNENPSYHVDGWLRRLDTVRRRRVWWAGVDTLAAVGRIDAHEPAFDFLPLSKSGETSLRRQLSQQLGFLDWVEAQAQPYPLLRSVLEWLETNAPAAPRSGLCWGDAKLGNCLFDEETDACTGALDWEGVHRGDPTEDLAWWLVLDRSFWDGYGFARLDGLPDEAQTVAHWEQATGVHAVDLDYYRLLAAFEFALIMARIGVLFTMRGLVPAAQSMDLNNGGMSVLKKLLVEYGLPLRPEWRGHIIERRDGA